MVLNKSALKWLLVLLPVISFAQVKSTGLSVNAPRQNDATIRLQWQGIQEVKYTEADSKKYLMFEGAAVADAALPVPTYQLKKQLKGTPASIEVTLAIASDDKAPETADFIASSNQVGSGTIDELLETTTTDPADFQSNEYTPTYVEEDPAPQQLKDQETLLTTEEAQPDKVSLDPADPSELNNNPNPPNFKR